jgi:lysophospholipase L1-like esterase
MQQVLVYSDSLSWGIIPATCKRLAFHARWPGVMEIALVEQGHPVRVIEDCLNGRRTVWDESMHPHTAWHAAQGMAALVAAVRQAPIEPGMPGPPILVIAPPPTTIPRGPIADKFTGAADKAAGLADAYRGVAAELDCHFFDAGSVTSTSVVDGIHLDADQHLSLGRALARCVAALPGVLPPSPA